MTAFLDLPPVIRGDNGEGSQPVFVVENLSVFYGSYQALADVSLTIRDQRITSLIGPSGCGKSTLLRALNRMNDIIPKAKTSGQILFRGQPLYGRGVDPVKVRRYIGMVFQKANPFSKSVYDNVAFGQRLLNRWQPKPELDELVEITLRRVGLWDEVKDKLKEQATNLSGGQQQRLCIARALAVTPQVLLLDEPCSALDPQSTRRIEDLLQELKEQVAIIIVTHNLMQATRISDETAFFHASEEVPGQRIGRLVEMGATAVVFGEPRDRRTADYIQGY